MPDSRNSNITLKSRKPNNFVVSALKIENFRKSSVRWQH